MLNLRKTINKTVNKSTERFSNMKTHEVLLAVILVVYLVSGVSTPYNLSPYVNNVFMYVSLICLVVLLFLYSKPLLAILFAVVAMVFINRNQRVSHVKMAPSQKNKDADIKKLNNHLEVKTLEEEVVGIISVKPDNMTNPSSYNPVLCATHNASEI
jgi:c-di-AMP phosphodiesterase-like protein